MIEDPFYNMQCLLCYKTFKGKNEFVLKRHFECYHSKYNEFSNEDRENIFQINKQIFFWKE